MKTIRRSTALVLILSMLLCLTGCAIASGEAKPEESSDREKLTVLLDRIASEIQPGTSGSTLRAIRVTADLVNWASKSELSAKEAADTVRKWLDGQPQEKKDAFTDQLKQIAENYGKLALDGAKDLLDSAGVQETIAEYSGNLKEIIESILASGGIEES